MKSLTIYLTDLRSSLVWHIAWIFAIAVTWLITVGIYPGDKAMGELIPLLQTPYVQDLIGNIGSASPGYALWIFFMIPFIDIMILIYAMTSGVRAGVQSVSDGTGELLNTLPVSRTNYALTRMVSNFTPLVIYFIIQAIIFLIPVSGSSMKLDIVFNITWWGILFCLFGMLLGMFLGLIVGNATKGHELSIVLVLVFYAIQVLTNTQTNLNYLNDINPLSFFNPGDILLGNGFVKQYKIFGFTYYYYPVLLVLLSIVLFVLILYEYNRKDLSDDAGFHFNIFKRISLKKHFTSENSFLSELKFVLIPFVFVKNILFPKNVRNNPFVFWARALENKLPITADFIYSDNVVIFIAIFATFLFFPLQIGYYPGNKVVNETMGSFGSIGLINVFVYGHNLTADPYLWYITISALGTMWMILIPLVFFWVRKAVTRDGNSGTGEIFGGIAINNRTVVIQRMIAMFLELVLIDLVMVFWLLLSEAMTGKTFDKFWEVMAIIGLLPLYIFLISFTTLITLIFKKLGNLISGLFLAVIILSFIMSVISPNLNYWYLRGIFSLYDPVAIVTNKSFTTNNNGLTILSILSVISIAIVVGIASKFTWLNISNRAETKN